MDSIRRFLASVVSIFCAIVLVSSGAVVFIFGGLISTLLMIGTGIVVAIGVIAYGIYEFITGDDTDTH